MERPLFPVAVLPTPAGSQTLASLWLRLPEPPGGPLSLSPGALTPRALAPTAALLPFAGRGSWPGRRRARPLSAGTRRGAAGLPAQRPCRPHVCPLITGGRSSVDAASRASLRTELPLCDYSLTFSPLVFIRSLCLEATVYALNPPSQAPPAKLCVSPQPRCPSAPLLPGTNPEGRAPGCLHSSLSCTVAWPPPCRAPGQGTLLLKPELPLAAHPSRVFVSNEMIVVS